MDKWKEDYSKFNIDMDNIKQFYNPCKQVDNIKKCNLLKYTNIQYDTKTTIIIKSDNYVLEKGGK